MKILTLQTCILFCYNKTFIQQILIALSMVNIWFSCPSIDVNLCIKLHYTYKQIWMVKACIEPIILLMIFFVETEALYQMGDKYAKY
jgi:hypothetical protein